VRPYRVSGGVATKSTEFKDVTGNNPGQIVCVQDSPNPADNDACPGGGFQSYKDNSTYDLGYETKPYYFSQYAGTSFFISYNSVNTTLLDYPTGGQNSTIRISRWSVNEYVYLNFGDKYFKNNKGTNARIGIGVSVNFINGLNLTNTTTSENINEDNKFALGYNFIAEANMDWFYIRLTNSVLAVKADRFSGQPDNKLNVSDITVALGLAYYFEEQKWYDSMWSYLFD
jgi:hypothetical protein